MLVERGIKYKKIAELAGVKPATVYVVLNGHRKSKKIQDAIAATLDMPYHEVWKDKI